jgi:hypothetical protein
MNHKVDSQFPRTRALALLMTLAFWGSAPGSWAQTEEAVYRVSDDGSVSKTEAPKKRHNRSGKKLRDVKLQEAEKLPDTEKPKEKLCTILVPTEAGLLKREISCDKLESI